MSKYTIGIMQYATEIEIRDNFFTRHEAEIHPSSLMEDVEDLLSKVKCNCIMTCTYHMYSNMTL